MGVKKANECCYSCKFGCRSIRVGQRVCVVNKKAVYVLSSDHCKKWEPKIFDRIKYEKAP